MTDDDDDNDDDDDDDDDDANIRRTRNHLRSVSLDSFDKFCRSGSVSKEDRNKKRHKAGNDDDDDDDDGFVERELEAISPRVEAIEGM